MRVLLIASILTLVWAAAAGAQVLPDRLTVLEDLHGYFPCMDCHGDQETVTTPRILDLEHYEPFEWEDDEGNVHLVPFGRYVELADLLGEGGSGDLAHENLARIGARLEIGAYMEEFDLAPTDSVWTLVHGGGNLWCLSCHDTEDRDKLKSIDGELLTFNQSHLLCGGCHGPKLRDWEAGIHGKTVGYWDPARGEAQDSIRMLCVECHSAHDPAFQSFSPMPGPVTRVDGPDAGKAAHGTDEPGEADH